jgi:hypothetical protein
MPKKPVKSIQNSSFGPILNKDKVGQQVTSENKEGTMPSAANIRPGGFVI